LPAPHSTPPHTHPCTLPPPPPGGRYGQELLPREMQRLIRANGRTPLPRTTTYARPPAHQSSLALTEAAEVPLAPLAMGYQR